MELRVARSQKPFVVEVKRGRRGAAAAPLTVVPKSPEAAHKVAAEPAPPPEPPKPPRRILDAIEPEPVVPEAAEAAPFAADPVKRRRGRPPKLPGAPPTPRKQRLAVTRREETPVITRARRDYPFVAAEKAAPSREKAAPSRESKAAPRPQGQSHANSSAHVAAPSLSPSAVAPGHATHGHLSHGDRVEAATGLPRGERWKRRLPKVLW
jgi:hypothetical protein